MNNSQKKFTMSQKEAQTVVNAIVRWERYLETHRKPRGECPLCRVFRCDNCPVALYTGELHCEGTPYKADVTKQVARNIIAFGKKMLDDAGWEMKDKSE